MLNRTTKKVVFGVSALFGAFCNFGVSAIYQTDKGKNEWHVETLGEIADLILFADSQAYTLSTDGLLTLFNTSSQTIEWKK